MAAGLREFGVSFLSVAVGVDGPLDDSERLIEGTEAVDGLLAITEVLLPGRFGDLQFGLTWVNEIGRAHV